MTEIEIGEMTPDEIEQAAAIHRTIIQGERADRLKYDPAELLRSHMENSPRTTLCARVDGKVAGFVIGRIRDWAFGLERAGWIEVVGVDPQHMGSGVGKELGEALIKIFKEEGVEQVYTTVVWDSGDLISFFKSLGFTKSSFINLRLARD